MMTSSQTLTQVMPRRCKVGDPLDLSSRHRRGEFADHSSKATSASSPARCDEGAELALGRHPDPAGHRRLLHGADHRDRRDTGPPFAQEEVFGPVLAVTPFRSEDEAVALANSTDYGLAAGVWTVQPSAAPTAWCATCAPGVVHVNTYGGADNTVPLGGVKQSGNGHDKIAACVGQVSRPQDRVDQLYDRQDHPDRRHL